MDVCRSCLRRYFRLKVLGQVIAIVSCVEHLDVVVCTCVCIIIIGAE